MAAPARPSSSVPSSLREALQGAPHILVADALFLPVGLLTVIFLTRELGPDGYGLYALCAAIVIWAEWLVAAAFSRATLAFIGEADDWRPVAATALRLYGLTGLGATLVLWLAAGAVAAALHEPRVTWALRLFAVVVPLSSLSTAHRQVLDGLGRFKQRAYATTAYWVSRLLLIVAFVEIGLAVPGVIAACIAACAVQLAVARRYVRPPWRVPQRLPAHRFWTYAVPLFVYALSSRLFSTVDLLAVKALGGTAAQAGVYGAAQNLAQVPSLLLLSLSPVLLSVLTRVLRDGKEAMAREIGDTALRVTVAVLPLLAAVAGAAPDVVALAFGPRFSGTAPLLAILIFGAWARTLIAAVVTMMTAIGEPRWAAILAVPLVPLALLGHFLLIPRYGPAGAAAVTTVLSMLGALAACVVLRRRWTVALPLATAVRACVLSPVAYVAASGWSAPAWAVLIKLPAATLLALLGYVLLGEVQRREAAQVWSMLAWRSAARQGRSV